MTGSVQSRPTLRTQWPSRLGTVWAGAQLVWTAGRQWIWKKEPFLTSQMSCWEQVIITYFMNLFKHFDFEKRKKKEEESRKNNHSLLTFHLRVQVQHGRVHDESWTGHFLETLLQHRGPPPDHSSLDLQSEAKCKLWLPQVSPGCWILPPWSGVIQLWQGKMSCF